MKITNAFFLPENEINFTYMRASGPGGQNVNKVTSAVQLRFNIQDSAALTEELKARLSKLAGRRLTQEGILIIEAKRYRSQEQNRLDAVKRLAVLVQKAIVTPKKRRRTRPSVAAEARRLDAKRRRAEIKRLRRTGEEG